MLVPEQPSTHPAAAGREALTLRSLSTSAGIPLCPLPLADPGPSPPHTPPPLPLRPLPLSSCSVFFPLCWPAFQLTGDAAKRGERTTGLCQGQVCQTYWIHTGKAQRRNAALEKTGTSKVGNTQRDGPGWSCQLKRQTGISSRSCCIYTMPF